jgi:GntR family transcriptional repressor for pyruvate dehydrogenase complex
MQGPFRVWIELNASEVVNLLKVRRSLDGLAAAEAADNASEESLCAVVSAERAFAEAVQSGEDPVRLASLDKRLHVGIATASGLAIVSNLLTELDHHSANIHRTSLAMQGRAEVSVVEHRAILEAIQTHDPDRARQAAESHVSSSIEQVRAILAPKPK